MGTLNHSSASTMQALSRPRSIALGLLALTLVLLLWQMQHQMEEEPDFLGRIASDHAMPKALIVTSANKGFDDMVFNWHLSLNGLEKLYRISLPHKAIVEDCGSCDHFKKLLGEEFVICDLCSNTLSGNAEHFGDKAYQEITYRRPKHLMHIFESGVELLMWTDSDSVFMDDPWSDWRRRKEEDPQIRALTTVDSFHKSFDLANKSGRQLVDEAEQGSLFQNVCSCLIVLEATPSEPAQGEQEAEKETQPFVYKLLEDWKNKVGPNDSGDQVAWAKVWFQNRRDKRIRLGDPERYCGGWIRNNNLCQKPLWGHVNWIVGHDTKVRHLYELGLWQSPFCRLKDQVTMPCMPALMPKKYNGHT
eukprot:Clim_evm20s240 gene=Clim_evmTU20s240